MSGIPMGTPVRNTVGSHRVSHQAIPQDFPLNVQRRKISWDTRDARGGNKRGPMGRPGSPLQGNLMGYPGVQK